MATRNELLIDDARIQQIFRMFDTSNPDGIPLYASGTHEMMQTWPRIAATWREVYDFYLDFEENTHLRKMTLSAFIQCVKRTQKYFKLSRTTTDACDMLCNQIRTDNSCPFEGETDTLPPLMFLH